MGSLSADGAVLTAEGVVVTGAYGTGKTSVVEEMAAHLERERIAYAAIDVDWLWWFDLPGLGANDQRRILMENLRAVVGNYLKAGITRFLLAWAMRSRDDVEAIRGAVPFPLRVVRLTVPLNVVRDRLASAVTTGRSADLSASERWFAEGTGSEVGDVAVDNDRPIEVVATDILRWLGWLES